MSKEKVEGVDFKDTDLFKKMTNNNNLLEERASRFIKKIYRGARNRMSDMIGSLELMEAKKAELLDFGVKTKDELTFDEKEADSIFEKVAGLENSITLGNVKLENYKKTYASMFGREYSE